MLHRTQAILLGSLDFLSLLLGHNTFSPRLCGQGERTKKAWKERRDTTEQETEENSSQSRGASLTMVRASTQQTVDRIVGTAVVVGLSVAFVRWLSRPSASRRKRIEGEDKREDRVRNDGEHREKRGPEKRAQDDDKEYKHQGSCHCSSIIFVLRGPQRLNAVDSPGKIRYPHIPTPADRFQLLRGEGDMRFYYEDCKDDTSAITFDLAGDDRSVVDDASGAHVFCGNCGVHVFYAERASGRLEVNANCLDGGEATLIFSEPSASAEPTSISFKRPERRISPSKSPPSSLLGGANEIEKVSRHSTIETVSETEQFLGSAYILESLDDRKFSHLRKGSLSSDPTQPESQSTTMLAEGDDSSMGSSSLAYLMHDGMDRSGLPPLAPQRISSEGILSSRAPSDLTLPSRVSSDRILSSRVPSSDQSAKTMPPQFKEQAGHAKGSSGWSVASMESNDDMDAGSVGRSRISPRMRDQMKKYMQKYT